eukprot:394101_1
MSDVEMRETHFQIFVRIVTGRDFKTYTLTVKSSDYIQDISKQLSIKTHVPASIITLSYRSRILYPYKTIQFYNINSESALNATTRCKLSNSNTDTNICGAFPISISNEELRNKINTINSLINNLKHKYENKIISNSNSIYNLNKIWQQITNTNTYNNEMNKFNNNKLIYLKEIYTNNELQKQNAQFEIETITKDMHHITEFFNCNPQKEIKTYINNDYEAIIFETNDQKLQKQQELRIKNEKLRNSMDELNSIDKQMEDIKNKLKSDETVGLQECFQEVLHKLEKEYSEWSKNDIIEWIKAIKNGYGQFNENVCKKLIEAIDNLNISGDILSDLRNDSFLKLIGLNLMERKMVLKHIDMVLNNGNEINSNICTICVRKRINAVFVPCGHQSCCYECCEKEKQRFHKCPICRQIIERTIKTFMNGF